MSTIIIVLQALVLVIAVGIDAFACSFGYGASKITIPFKSVVIINVVCSALLAAGLFLGTSIGHFVPQGVGEWIAFAILFVLGVFKLFDSTIKKAIRKCKEGAGTDSKFSLLNLGFVLKIYADPEEADIDGSKELSPKEAAPLAVALGLDGLSVGFGVGIGAALASAFLIVGLSLVIGVILVMLGCLFGNKIASRTSLDLSWLSGAILITIAIVGVVF